MGALMPAFGGEVGDGTIGAIEMDGSALAMEPMLPIPSGDARAEELAGLVAERGESGRTG